MITVSNLNSAKGVDLIPGFIESIPNFAENFIWLLVGSKGGDIGAIQSSIDKKGLSNAFFQIDRLPQREIGNLFEISSYYLMHHRVAIFDLATLEAMSFGLVPVLSSVGGNLEVNKQGNVLYVDNLKQEELAMLADAEFIEMQSAKNKQVFDQSFNNESFLKAYLTFAKRVCGNGL
jgi:glycosyltransferase involved in cell wall biosynthesis